MIDILCVLADGRWKIGGKKVRPFSLVWCILNFFHFFGYIIIIAASYGAIHLMSFLFGKL